MKRNLTYDIKINTLYCLTQYSEPRTFTEILQYLMMHPGICEGKNVKRILATVLDGLESGKLICREKVDGRKNVRYSINSQKKDRIDRLLRTHLDFTDEIVQKAESRMMAGKSIDELNGYALRTFLTCLERYELELCEARLADDFESCNEIDKDILNYLRDFWSAFSHNIRSVSVAETEEFLKRNRISVSSVAEDVASEILRLNNLKRILDPCVSLIAEGLENYSGWQKKINETEKRKRET
jgi:hypothetical protein